MKNIAFKKGFTLIELLVVITIIAMLAGIALPVFNQVQIKGQQTQALSNAKQIGMALKLYATDNNGNYPSYTLSDGRPTTTPVSDSNAAFAQLFPVYLQNEAIFWLPHSAFCSTARPDGVIDSAALDTPQETLKAGENGWAYVLALDDTTNPALPILATGFSDPGSHTYAKDQAQPGGLWNGKNTIIIRVDSSGALVQVNQQDMTVHGSHGDGTQSDIFASGNGWLGAANTVVNPSQSGGANNSDMGGTLTNGSGGTGSGYSLASSGANTYSGATNLSGGLLFSGASHGNSGSASLGSAISSSFGNIQQTLSNGSAGSMVVGGNGQGSGATGSTGATAGADTGATVSAGSTGGTLSMGGGGMNLSSGATLTVGSAGMGGATGPQGSTPMLIFSH